MFISIPATFLPARARNPVRFQVPAYYSRFPPDVKSCTFLQQEVAMAKKKMKRKKIKDLPKAKAAKENPNSRSRRRSSIR
jgi:hypothetical protein